MENPCVVEGEKLCVRAEKERYFSYTVATTRFLQWSATGMVNGAWSSIVAFIVNKYIFSFL